MILIDKTGIHENRLTNLFVSQKRNVRAACKRSEKIPRQIKPYQAGVIYALMAQYNLKGNLLFEMGTRLGYSASIIAQAVPNARVITWELLVPRITRAQVYVQDFKNLKVRQGCSWDLLKKYNGPELSAIFIDGDHKYAHKDAPWFNHLKQDGLILFHDYTEKGSIHVVNTVNRMESELGRPPDVKVIDYVGVGMAGFYRNNLTERLPDDF